MISYNQEKEFGKINSTRLMFIVGHSMFIQEGNGLGETQLKVWIVEQS